MSRKVLVVDDEAPIREMLVFVLEQNGFQAIEAEDYDSAIAAMVEPYPDFANVIRRSDRSSWSAFRSYFASCNFRGKRA